MGPSGGGMRLADDGGMPLLLQPFRSVPSPKECDGKKRRLAMGSVCSLSLARSSEPAGPSSPSVRGWSSWPDQGLWLVDSVVGLLFNKVGAAKVSDE